MQSRFALANPLHSLHSAHFRHLVIDQDQIERFRLPSLDRFHTGRHHPDVMAALIEGSRGDDLVYRIVLGQQDLQRPAAPDLR
jgi:hypothetical protein